MTTKNRKLRHGAGCIIYGILIALIATFTTTTLLLVWPYDDASFKGEAKVMYNGRIEPGATITLQWQSFCVQGQDLYYERWADVYDGDSTPIYSYGIPPFIAYHAAAGCTSPADGPITLPNYLPPGTYRLRFLVSYKPNFLRTVTVTTQSEEFTVYPKAVGPTAPLP